MKTKVYPKLFFYCIFLSFPILLTAQSLFLPNTMSDKRKGKEIKEDVSFVAYPFKKSEIDLRDFKQRYQYDALPNSISIVEPPITNRQELTVLITMLQGVPADENALVIWLAEDFGENEVTFYIDKDLDRNFTTDTEIKVLTPMDEVYYVDVRPKYGNLPVQKLALKIPRKKGDPIVNIPKQSKIYNQLAIGIQAGAGIGSLKYNFFNLERGFPTWYSINFSSKGLGTTLSYSTRLLNLEVSANYQSVFSYTSYLNIRFDHPEIVVDANGNSRKIDNVIVERNFDRHAIHRLQLAANLGFRIHLSKTFEMQPFIGVGRTYHAKRKYAFSRYNEDHNYTMDPMFFAQAGLRMEFLSKPNRTFFINLYYQENDWRPEGFFERIPHSSLQVDHRFYLFDVGYRIGL